MLFKGNKTIEKNIFVFQMPVFEDIPTNNLEPEKIDDNIVEELATPKQHSDIPDIQDSIDIHLIEQEAYNKGLEAGERLGFQSGLNKAKIVIEGIEKVYEEIKNIKEKFINEIEPEIINLSFEIAKKIIVSELSSRPELVLNIVNEAMKKIEVIDKVIIKLNPALYEVFVDNKSKLISNNMDVHFDIDPSVPVFGPIVVGSKEEVVTDIEEQLKIIRQYINDVITVE